LTPYIYVLSFFSKILPGGVSKSKSELDILKSELDNVKKQLVVQRAKANLKKKDISYGIESTKVIELQYNDKLILAYCDASPLVGPIIDAIVREVTTPGWAIFPMFHYKCTRCSLTYDVPPNETNTCTCGGKLRTPDVGQKNKMEMFLDNPNNEYDFYDIIRSALRWELPLDKYYMSVSYVLANKQNQYMLMDEPQGLFVEDARYIRVYKNANELFCPVCYEADTFYTDKTTCPTCGGPLWETAYVTKVGNNIINRFAKKEIIEGHLNRRLPDPYGTPKVISCINQLHTQLAMDVLNRATYTKGKLAKIFAFIGVSQEDVDALVDDINEKKNDAESTAGSDKVIDLYMGSQTATDIKVIDALPDPRKMMSLEWYKLYQETIARVFGVAPVYAGIIESGKSGVNPQMQIDVMNNTTRAVMRSITEPVNSNIMKNLGITDWYFDFNQVEQKDQVQDEMVYKIRAEAAKLLVDAGFDVTFNSDKTMNIPLTRELPAQTVEPYNYSKSCTCDDPTHNHFAKGVIVNPYYNEQLIEQFRIDLESIIKRYNKNIITLTGEYSGDRSKIFRAIETEIDDMGKAIDTSIRYHAYPIFSDGYNKLYKKKSKDFKKSDDPYALAYLQEFLSTYKTPFMGEWSQREKRKIFEILENLALSEDGFTPATAAQALLEYFTRRDSYYWGMVALTESARFYVESGKSAALDLGATKKRSVMAGVGCPICEQAESEGWIDIKSNYSVGKGVPFHPNCQCYEDFL